MTSDKIKAVKAMLAAARANDLVLNGSLIKALQRALSGIHEEVLQLEAAQVPPAQRVTPADVASGKVLLMPFERPFA